MTDEDESNAIKQQNGPASAKNPRGKNKSIKGWFWFLFFLVVLGTIAATAWRLLPHEPLRLKLQTLPFASKTSPSTLPPDSKPADSAQSAPEHQPTSDDTSANLPPQLRQQNQAIRQLQEQVVNLQQTVTVQAERLNNLGSSHQQNWQLIEAGNLLQLANQRLLLQQDSRSALGLAEEADRLLSQLNLPGLYPVRQHLAEDISALKLVEHVDREGIYLRLRALEKQMSQLPLQPDFKPAPQRPEAKPPEQAEKSPLRSSWQSFVNFLQKSVRIEDGGINPVLLSTQNEFFFRQSLRLHMQQAELAVLRADAAVYKDALADAQQLLKLYGVANQQRQTILNELQALQQTTVANKLPNLNDSQKSLQDYLEQLSSGPNSLPEQKPQQPLPLEKPNGSNNANGSGGSSQ